MKDRDARAAVVARLQLVASQLVQDIKDLQAGLQIEEDPADSAQLKELDNLVVRASKGAIPAFQDRTDAYSGNGRLMPDRSERLASLDEDEELFNLVSNLRQDEPHAVTLWTESVHRLIETIRTIGWREAMTDHKEQLQELEQFLERMERLDESESHGRPRHGVPA